MDRYVSVEQRKCVGDILRRLREDSGLSQNQLSAELGVDHSHINRIERGASAPGDALLADYEKHFGLAAGLLQQVKWWAAQKDMADLTAFLLQSELVVGDEHIADLEVTIEISPKCECVRWQAQWVTTHGSLCREAANLQLLGVEHAPHEGPSPRRGNRVVIRSPFPEAVAAHQQTTASYESRPSKSLSRFLLIPMAGQIITNASIQIVWPSAWEVEGTLMLFPTNQRIDGNTFDIGMTYGGSRYKHIPPTVYDRVFPLDTPFKFRDIPPERVIGLQWKFLSERSASLP